MPIFRVFSAILPQADFHRPCAPCNRKARNADFPHFFRRFSAILPQSFRAIALYNGRFFNRRSYQQKIFSITAVSGRKSRVQTLESDARATNHRISCATEIELGNRIECGFAMPLAPNRKLMRFQINVLAFLPSISRQTALQNEMKAILSQSPKRKRNHFGIAGRLFRHAMLFEKLATVR